MCWFIPILWHRGKAAGSESHKNDGGDEQKHFLAISRRKQEHIFPEAPGMRLSFHRDEPVGWTLGGQKSSSVEPTYVFKHRSLHSMLQEEPPSGHKGAERMSAFIISAALGLMDFLNKELPNQGPSIFGTFLCHFQCFSASFQDMFTDRETFPFKASFSGPLALRLSRHKTSASPW